MLKEEESGKVDESDEPHMESRADLDPDDKSSGEKSRKGNRRNTRRIIR